MSNTLRFNRNVFSQTEHPKTCICIACEYRKHKMYHKCVLPVWGRICVCWEGCNRPRPSRNDNSATVTLTVRKQKHVVGGQGVGSSLSSRWHYDILGYTVYCRKHHDLNHSHTSKIQNDLQNYMISYKPIV